MQVDDASVSADLKPDYPDWKIEVKPSPIHAHTLPAKLGLASGAGNGANPPKSGKFGGRGRAMVRVSVRRNWVAYA